MQPEQLGVISSALKQFNNNVTSLDVTNNLYLKELFCSGNQIETLDVSNNTSLLSFGCGYNHLSSLDVSKNTKLKI